MVGFLKIMVPILLIVFLLMGVWVSVLHFPWEWMTYVAMGFGSISSNAYFAI